MAEVKVTSDSNGLAEAAKGAVPHTLQREILQKVVATI